MKEIFIHSLELGHSAATRAIKASGGCCLSPGGGGGRGPGGGGPRVWEGYRKPEGVKVCPCGPGPGSKRLGIDGDREAVPLTLQIIYSKVRLLLGAPVPLGPVPDPSSPRVSPARMCPGPSL